MTDSSYTEIDSSRQDRNWPAPKLMAVGALALAFAIALIYTAASLIGE